MLKILMFLFFAQVVLLTGAQADYQCNGALRVNIEALEATKTALTTAIDQLETRRDTAITSPSTFQLSSEKRVQIVDDKTAPAGTFSTSDTYDKMIGVCVSRGHIPLVFTYNERFAMYKVLKKFGFPKVVLNVQATSLNTFWGANGQLTHFEKYLEDDLSTTAKRDALKFLFYSVDKDGLETVEVINSPFTLVEYGTTEKHFYPFLCEPSDAISSRLLGVKEEIKVFVDEHSHLLTNYTAELQLLLNDTRSYIQDGEKPDSSCPDIELFQQEYEPLFPFHGSTRWPSTLGDEQQEQFIQKWKDLKINILSTPKYIKRARQLLQYSHIVPSRNNYLYVFTSQFYRNLGNAEPFEVMISICIMIIFMTACCLLYCLRKVFCPNVPIASVFRCFGRILPSWPTLSRIFRRSQDQDNGPGNGAGGGQVQDEGGGYPMRAYGQNFAVFPPRNMGRNQGRFQIILQQDANRNNRPVQDIVEL